MGRTELLQVLRKMRFEQTYEGRKERNKRTRVNSFAKQLSRVEGRHSPALPRQVVHAVFPHTAFRLRPITPITPPTPITLTPCESAYF